MVLHHEGVEAGDEHAAGSLQPESPAELLYDNRHLRALLARDLPAPLNSNHRGSRLVLCPELLAEAGDLGAGALEAAHGLGIEEGVHEAPRGWLTTVRPVNGLWGLGRALWGGLLALSRMLGILEQRDLLQAVRADREAGEPVLR